MTSRARASDPLPYKNRQPKNDLEVGVGPRIGHQSARIIVRLLPWSVAASSRALLLYVKIQEKRQRGNTPLLNPHTSATSLPSLD